MAKLEKWACVVIKTNINGAQALSCMNLMILARDIFMLLFKAQNIRAVTTIQLYLTPRTAQTY